MSGKRGDIAAPATPAADTRNVSELPGALEARFVIDGPAALDRIAYSSSFTFAFIHDSMRRGERTLEAVGTGAVPGPCGCRSWAVTPARGAAAVVTCAAPSIFGPGPGAGPLGLPSRAPPENLPPSLAAKSPPAVAVAAAAVVVVVVFVCVCVCSCVCSLAELGGVSTGVLLGAATAAVAGRGPASAVAVAVAVVGTDADADADADALACCSVLVPDSVCAVFAP